MESDVLLENPDIEVLRVNEHDEVLNAVGRLIEYSVVYHVSGAKSMREALRYALLYAPKSENSMQLSKVKKSSYENDIYEITCSYAYDNGSYEDEDDNELEPTVSFDCGTSTVRVQQAISQVQIAGDEIKIGNFVGWNGKNGDEQEFAGVDTYAPTIKKSWTQPMKYRLLTPAFERQIFQIAGKVNINAYKGYEAGELLFVGASYSGNADNKSIINVTYNFAIQFNENTTISGIKVDKKGWEYLWSVAEPSQENENIIKIKGMWLSKVYQEVNFNMLGIK